MNEKPVSKVLMVPGIGNSGPAHWQSIWEKRYPNCQRVQQRDWDRPVCDDWVAALDAAIIETGPHTVVVAHSLGCLVVATWAARVPRSIQGALLVAIPDPHGDQFPSEAIGFSSTPVARVPCRSIVVASTNDPYGSVAYAARCATAWGSKLIELGALGHINAASGLGEWSAGLALLDQLTLRTDSVDR